MGWQSWCSNTNKEPGKRHSGIHTGKLRNMSEISWFVWVFLLVLIGFPLCYLKAVNHWKNASTLMVCLGKNQLDNGQHFPMNCSNIGHSCEAFTYKCLAEITSLPALSKQIFFCRSLKIKQSRENSYKSVMLGTSFEKLSLKKCLWKRCLSKKMISISHQNHGLKQIFLWLLNFQRSAGEYLFAEWRQMKIFQRNRYINASHGWPILEQFMGKCCPIVSCLDRPSKLRHFFNGEEPSNNTIENLSKPTKNLIQTSWFIFILQFTCGHTCVEAIYTYCVRNWLNW